LAKKKRVSRKRLLKDPDEFITAWSKFLQYVFEHLKFFYLVITIIIALAICSSVLSYVIYDQKKDASEMLERGIDAYHDAGKNEDDLLTALSTFDTIIEKYPFSDVRDLAYLYRGHILYDLARYEEAVESYEKAEKKLDKPLDRLAREGKGYAYEKMGEYDSASEIFLSVLDTGDEQSYINLILTLHEAGKEDEAKSYFIEYVNLFPYSSDIPLLKEMLGLEVEE
jgi:tetratricopeptide (TPR) repeat protein